MGINPTVLLLLKSTANLQIYQLVVERDGWQMSEAGEYKRGRSEGRAFRKQKRDGALSGGFSGAQLHANRSCFYLWALFLLLET